MNKKDLTEAVAKVVCSKREAEEAVDAVIDGIKSALKKGEEVTLVGFGTFKVKKRAARTGINPKTKAKMKIPAKKVPVFKPGSELKKLVNK